MRSDPLAATKRTNSMESPLFTVEGMFHGSTSLAIEHLLDDVVVDSDGRLLVAMIDVLAMVRIDADAEVLLLQCHDGSSRALRLPDVVDALGLFLQLHVSDQPGSGDEPWTARLWSLDAGASSPVASILALSFASFVGQP